MSCHSITYHNYIHLKKANYRINFTIRDHIDDLKNLVSNNQTGLVIIGRSDAKSIDGQSLIINDYDQSDLTRWKNFVKSHCTSDQIHNIVILDQPESRIKTAVLMVVIFHEIYFVDLSYAMQLVEERLKCEIPAKTKRYIYTLYEPVQCCSGW